MEKKEIRLDPMQIGTLSIDVVGKTPLLMDKFPERVKEGIISKQTGEKRIQKELRNIDREVEEATWKTSDGVIGFPASGFKAGMMSVAASFTNEKKSNPITKRLISGALRITNQVDGLIPIDFKKQSVLEHQVFENTKYSPCFHDWKCKLVFNYDATALAPHDIITLLNYAGFRVGIGAWRPMGKKGGSGEYGMYEVKTNGRSI